MSTTHSIADLFRKGAVPTAEEAFDLAKIGAFASTLHARHLLGLAGGARPPVDAAARRAGRFANHLSGRLSASTGERWSSGLGVGGAFFGEDGLEHFRRLAAGARPGYFGLELDDLATVDLFEDQPIADAPASPDAPRARRGPLFGTRTPKAAGGRKRSDAGAGRPPASRDEVLRLVKGGSVAVETVRALVRGGLSIADQIAPRGPVGSSRRGAATSLRLDGLVVDDRTPALLGGLSWAEAAFGAVTSRSEGLAGTTSRASALLRGSLSAASGPAALGLPASGRAGRTASLAEPGRARPAYALFDSERGEFVSIAAGPLRETSSFEAQIGAEGASSSSGASGGGIARVSRLAGPSRPASGVAPGRAAHGLRDVSLSRIVAPAAALLAFQGSRPASSVVVSRIAHAPSGSPEAAKARTSLGAPRIPVRLPEAAAGPGRREADEPALGWRLAADLGPDLPLGAGLGRHERMAGSIAVRAGAALAGAGAAEAFRPVVSGAASTPRDLSFAGDALDGVAWLSLDVDSEHGASLPGDSLPLSLVPRGRAASQVRASVALASQTGAAPVGSGGFAASIPTPGLPQGGTSRFARVGGSGGIGFRMPAVGYAGFAGVDRGRTFVALAEPTHPAAVADEAALPSRRSAWRPAFPAAIAARRAGRDAGGVAARALARDARQALRRPVLTAREVLSAAPLLSAAGPLSARPSDRPTSLAPSPSLAVHLEARRGAAWPAVATLAPHAAELLGGLSSEGAGASGAARTLRLAGWTEPELAMLSLEAPGSGGRPEGGAALGFPAVAGGDLSAGHGGRLQRMARNLARIATGTEAVSTAGARTVEGLLAGAQPLGDRPAIGRYFEGVAPDRVRMRPASGLRDAIGELLEIAEAQAAAEGPVLGGDARGSALGSILSRLRAAESGLVRGASGNRAGTGIAATPATRSASPLGTATVSARASEMKARDVAPTVLRPENAERMKSVGSAAVPGTSRPGYRALDEADRAFVTAAEPASPESVGSPGELPAARATGLAARLDRVLSQSSRGPAGLDRLTRPLDARVRGAGDFISGRIGGAAVAEGSASLGPVLAPEALLGGMARRAAGRPARRPAHSIVREGVPGELAAFGAGEATPRGEAARGERGRPGSGRRDLGREGLVRLLSRIGEAGGDAGRTLVRAFSRGLAGGEALVSDRHGALADFALQWLGRVDGRRTGLDLGLGETSGEFQKAFADLSRRVLRIAGESPIDGADVVGPALERSGEKSSEREDRSGLRSVARELGSRRGRASRPHSKASEAMRETQWRFVETGSGASTTHADLGRMASSVLDAPGSAERLPMPLVAPAVKAVAQTALRKDRSEQPVQSGSSEGSSAPTNRSNGPDRDGKSATGEPVLSKEAFEALAIEMAELFARRMKREQERRGQWP